MPAEPASSHLLPGVISALVHRRSVGRSVGRWVGGGSLHQSLLPVPDLRQTTDSTPGSWDRRQNGEREGPPCPASARWGPGFGPAPLPIRRPQPVDEASRKPPARELAPGASPCANSTRGCPPPACHLDPAGRPRSATERLGPWCPVIGPLLSARPGEPLSQLSTVQNEEESITPASKSQPAAVSAGRRPDVPGQGGAPATRGRDGVQRPRVGGGVQVSTCRGEPGDREASLLL